MNKQLTLLLVFLIAICGSKTFATHIRAANITAERIGSTKYRIILSVYTDYKNVADNPNAISPNDVSELEIGLGDQRNPLVIITVPRASIREIVPGETYENIYIADYEFPSAFTGYKIFFVGQNRNENVINISNSVNSLIYVETFVYIDGFSPINSTPEFTVPPIDRAATNQIYTHNPGAFDIDGDSISFELIDPRDRVNKTVDGYRYPDDPSFGTPSDFSIDAKTGQITWNTPKTAGEYNIAYRVNEYRNGIRIGYVVRDMQINVFDTNNQPPIVKIPKDTCISVGQEYRETILANDPNNNKIGIELFGGLSELGGVFENVFEISPDVIRADVYWKPLCNAVGIQPIQGIVKVTDNHPVSLSTIATWNIHVIARPIQNVQTVSKVSEIELLWSPYDCQKEGAIIEIYRASCDTSLVQRSTCISGVPSDWGFTKIGEVGVAATSFIDKGTVSGLSSGVSYYYVLAVKFGTPSFGESYASTVVSGSLSGETPLFTQVSFNKTTQDKTLDIAWNHFTNVDTNLYNLPFVYRLTNDVNILFSDTVRNTENLTLSIDTSKIDLTKPLFLDLLDFNGNSVGSRSIAFAENLSSQGSDESLGLNWTNQNLWLYSDTLWQKIYSFKEGGDTLLIDSVQGNTNTYVIDGLTNGDSVCAYVELSYTYCKEGIDTVLYSYTNTSCDLVKDNVAPCAPLLNLDGIDCENQTIGNQLRWNNVFNNNCKDDIASYQIYKQDLVNTGPFNLISSENQEVNAFMDLSGKELACYYLTATDSSGNISANSNIVCQDFCGEVLFPNIFTPNGDGKNDFLESETIFKGYENLLFLVFNRWGKEIYRSQDFEVIHWDGKSSNGTEVNAGTYYIYFSGKKLTGSKELVEYKGWLQIQR